MFKLFEFFYILSTIMWAVFSITVISYLIGRVSFERFVLFSVLFLATLIEELFYMIKEKVILR